MKKCPFCKKEIPKEVIKCPHCHMTLAESVPHHHIHTHTHIHAHAYETHKAHVHVSYGKEPFWKKISGKQLFFAAIALFLVFIIGYAAFDSSDQKVATTPVSTPAPKPSTTLHDIFEGTSNVPAANTENTKPVQAVAQPSESPYSLPNGTVLKRNWTYLQGDGELSISNGTSHDAVAKLIRNGTSVFSVYIRANSKYTITGISDGYFDLLFALGNNWSTSEKRFLSNSGYEKFDDGFTYTTTTYQEGDYEHTRYSTYEVTLNPVIGGTAETSTVDPGQFNSY